VKTVIGLLIVTAVIGCAKKTPDASAANAGAPPPMATSRNSDSSGGGGAPGALPSGHPDVAAGSAAPAANPGSVGVTGAVEETLNAGAYTYLRLKTANGEVWAAVPKATVKNGASVTILNPAEMVNFESKTLNRKWERILFGTLAPDAAPAPADADSAARDQATRQMASEHSKAASGPSDVGDVKVSKAPGSDGKTVAEVFAERAALKDKNVSVHATVVKFLPGIMGKNWIHLRDGSGTHDKKDDDLTVTTMETAKPGDVVTVRGPVHLDRDFGAGYSYTVIVEDAKIQK